MFGAREADARGAERDGVLGLLGRVGIGADLQPGDLRAPLHQRGIHPVSFALLRVERLLDEDLDDFRGGSRELAGINVPGCPVDGKEIPFLERLAVHGESLGAVINLQRTRAANADLAHLTRDQRGMRTDTSFRREDAFGSNHAAQVFGRGFGADEHNFFAPGGGGVRAIGVEIHFSGGRARAGGQTFRDDPRSLLGLCFKDGREKLVKLIRGVASDGGLPVNEFLPGHIHGELERRHRRALAVAGLEHEHLAVLNREFEVLHFLEVCFQSLADVVEFGVGGGHFPAELRDGFGRAHARDDVLTLRVDEKFAVEFLHPVGGVAREGDSGAGGVTRVAINHRLHVDGRSPLGRDAVLAAIHDGAVVHPGAEHGAGGAPELLPRILREFLSRTLLDQGLETRDEFLLVGGGQLRVFNIRVILLMLESVDDDFKRLMVLVPGLLHSHDDIAIHLHETTIAVPGEAFVLRGLDQRQHGSVVKAEVENGVHHARHGITRA